MSLEKNALFQDILSSQTAKTKFCPSSKKRTLSRDDKIAHIAKHFQAIMEILDLDTSDPSLQKTPLRVAKMYVNEIFSGLDESNFPDMTILDTPVSENNSQNNILHTSSFVSFCEHHFLPVVGIAYISYIPQKNIIGLSKMNRLVRFFAKRPQLQERLTQQIADCLKKTVKTPHVAVYIEAKHFCVLARGIEDEASVTTTTSLHGDFQKNDLQKTFFDQISCVQQRARQNDKISVSKP